ncbi:hypothetical protein [Paradevosia shaoguanensis]|uniref:hypothetical protein n=1 Tax=Paradevosia shaoguanensis TaxID=1335043 RepID=UPI003C76AA91
MRLPEWTWHWAWTAFLRWALNPTLATNPTARQRWQVVLWSLWPGIKHHYLSPMLAWLHRKLPVAVAIARLERRGTNWYRVPSMPAAIHLWRRLGVHVLEGDLVRIEQGTVTMKGYVDEDLQICEFWEVDKGASNRPDKR